MPALQCPIMVLILLGGGLVISHTQSPTACRTEVPGSGGATVRPQPQAPRLRGQASEARALPPLVSLEPSLPASDFQDSPLIPPQV